MPLTRSTNNKNNGVAAAAGGEPADNELSETETKHEIGDFELPINISLLTMLDKANKKTKFQTIANLPWRVVATTEQGDDPAQTKQFAVFVECNPKSVSRLWSCEAQISIRLHSDVDLYNNVVLYEHTDTFTALENDWGAHVIKWQDLMNPARGYVKDNTVTVLVHLNVIKTTGVPYVPKFDFTQPRPESDCVLLVDGTRLHIDKQYLSLYSPVLATMFNGPFREAKMNEIELHDVEKDEFIEFLNVMYPSHLPVNADNVEFLLALGDRFQVWHVMRECERYLMKSIENAHDHDLITKLVWSDKYKLIDLNDKCLRTLTKTKYIKAIKQMDEYKQLSEATKDALFDRMCKLSD